MNIPYATVRNLGIEIKIFGYFLYVNMDGMVCGV